MKNRIKIVAPLFIIGISFILFSFTKESNEDYTTITTTDSIDFPEDVKTILDSKCMGCHNDEAKSGKSKMKLNFDKFTNGDYSAGKTISKLDKITKILSKDKMPPQKFLDNYPDKKLTAEETKIISDWASETSAKMKGE